MPVISIMPLLLFQYWTLTHSILICRIHDMPAFAVHRQHNRHNLKQYFWCMIFPPIKPRDQQFLPVYTFAMFQIL